MINYIFGRLIQKSPVRVVIETALGLAFELHIPISTFEVLPETGKDCKLFTHLHLAQDDVRLFGFATAAECELYQQLNKISGVGPKSAQRLIIELKGKLRHLLDYFEPGFQPVEESTLSEVENALQALGFNAKDVRRELSLMPEEATKMNSEQLLKEIIRRLYQRSK